MNEKQDNDVIEYIDVKAIEIETPSTRKNINISITYKELCVLEHLCLNKNIRASNGEPANLLMKQTNELIASNLGITPESEEAKNEGKKRKTSSFISRTVMYRILEKQIGHGHIAEGTKLDYAKTYYLTLKGIKFYAQLTELSEFETQQYLEAYEQINGKWSID